MKKITLTSIFLVCFLSLFGQTIDLSFTALDSTVYVQLDSVKVMNRTQGTETMLIWPDTTLSLEIDMGDLLLYVGFISFSPVGEQEISTERRPFELFQNYPNPVSDESSISLNIPERGTVNVAVSDLQGRQAFFADWNLEEGIHSFRFIPGNSSMYFLTARWNGMSRSIKILAAGSGNRQRCQVEYKGGSSEGSFLKASTQTRYVVMESGIVDMPETSTSYIFQFARNIPCPGTPSVTYEGHVYQTIQVFSQCWLKENLNVGTMISGTSEQLNNGTIEKYC